MKKAENDRPDDLRPEYDLARLSMRKFGPGRKNFGDIVRLEPDVAQAFSDADAVNEALRLLIRIARKSEEAVPQP